MCLELELAKVFSDLPPAERLVPFYFEYKGFKNLILPSSSCDELVELMMVPAAYIPVENVPTRVVILQKNENRSVQ